MNLAVFNNVNITFWKIHYTSNFVYKVIFLQQFMGKGGPFINSCVPWPCPGTCGPLIHVLVLLPDGPSSLLCGQKKPTPLKTRPVTENGLCCSVWGGGALIFEPSLNAHSCWEMDNLLNKKQNKFPALGSRSSPSVLPLASLPCKHTGGRALGWISPFCSSCLWH